MACFHPIESVYPNLWVRTKTQYRCAVMYHVYKHSDTNKTFYLISQQLKILTSRNCYIQLYSLLYKLSALRMFSIIVNFPQQHALKFTTIVGHYKFSSIQLFTFGCTDSQGWFLSCFPLYFFLYVCFSSLPILLFLFLASSLCCLSIFLSIFLSVCLSLPISFSVSLLLFFLKAAILLNLF